LKEQRVEGSEADELEVNFGCIVVERDWQQTEDLTKN
jgi:hypothetical protein